jgi:hypothetical protein
MIGISNGISCSLMVLAAASAPSGERQEVGRARASVSISHTALGSLRLEFMTLAPGANTDGVTATVQHDSGAPWTVHRILMDTERGLYYGYDIELSKGAVPGQFIAALKPLSTSVENEFRQERWRDFCRDCRPPRPVVASPQRFPGPQAVTAGDTLSIDLLADERSGELITDRITFVVARRASPSRPVTVFPPKDLRADAVVLKLAEATLHVNGRPAWAGNSDGATDYEMEGYGASVQGDVVWTEIPGHGRVFLSLAPRPGYEFKKIGVVAGDRISFSIDGDKYEWISKGPIATAGPVPPFSNVQSWFVWVLHDPDYRPLAGRYGGVGAGFDERAINRLKQP